MLVVRNVPSVERKRIRLFRVLLVLEFSFVMQGFVAWIKKLAIALWTAVIAKILLKFYYDLSLGKLDRDTKSLLFGIGSKLSKIWSDQKTRRCNIQDNVFRRALTEIARYFRNRR